MWNWARTYLSPTYAKVNPEDPYDDWQYAFVLLPRIGIDGHFVLGRCERCWTQAHDMGNWVWRRRGAKAKTSRQIFRDIL